MRLRLTASFLGGRTAWSSTVTVAGHQVPARYWYDGSRVNQAKEDAAEVALQRMGMASTAPAQQRWYGALNP
ncbi:hypothetical protein W97_05386 [Coniosporium apollinis CBS 100218]|uniref:DRBM domain-containing protein n=1 Tax=Coniosporium apollinis (strain CBS 100218) TaxID=1168221 RepID=R7YWD3_CONA1|nr:uncharacterized protein W97_05386 [Coniosporium apollinis CBS 100218]EON66143.1 hypothetical protein W97_05386 [Coniosporium apollinis CBS 100218]